MGKIKITVYFDKGEYLNKVSDLITSATPEEIAKWIEEKKTFILEYEEGASVIINFALATRVEWEQYKEEGSEDGEQE